MAILRMFLAPFDLLVAVDSTVGANMVRGLSLSVLRIKNIFGNLPLFISKVGLILAHNFVMIWYS